MGIRGRASLLLFTFEPFFLKYLYVSFTWKALKYTSIEVDEDLSPNYWKGKAKKNIGMLKYDPNVAIFIFRKADHLSVSMRN